MSDDAPYLAIKVGGVRRTLGDIVGTFDRSARISLPTRFSQEHLRTGQIDIEILAEKLRENAEEIRALLQAFIEGNNSEVERLVKGLGLREADFQAQDGGIFWAVVIIAVLCCASEAY